MKTIRGKLLTTYIVISLLIVLLLGAVFAWYVRDFYLDTLKERLTEEARIGGELLKPLLLENAASD